MKEKQIEANKRHLLQEVVPLEAPYVVYIDPSGACNFSCGFCPCNTVDYMNEQRHKIMSMEVFQKIVNDLKAFKNKIRVVYLFGFGEPLLNPNLGNMVKLLRNSGVCDEIRLYTNGVCLNHELNQQLVNFGVDLIRVSVNALSKEDYVDICKYDINYNLFLENIGDLYKRSRGKRTKVAVKLANITIKEKDQIEKFYDMYESIADYVFMEDISNVWSEFDGDQTVTDVIKKGNWTERNRASKICAYSLTTMVIHSNGFVSPCCSDWKFGATYGDINNNTVKEIWQSEELRHFQLIHLKRIKGQFEFCDNCSMRAVDDIDDVAEIIIQNLEGHTLRQNR